MTNAPITGSGALHGFTTQMHIAPDHAFQQLSNVHANIILALLEYMDNGIDAGATELVVRLQPNRLAVQDNGHGMLPEMYPWDETKYHQWMQDRRDKKPVGDIRRELDPLSLGTIRWMAENYGHSSKQPQEGELIRGMRAIGSASFWSFAHRAVYSTRPAVTRSGNRPGAVEYYRKLGDYYNEQSRGSTGTQAEQFSTLAQQAYRYARDPRTIPVFRAIPPSEEDLAQGQLDFRVTPITDRVNDVLGRPLTQGTMVEFTDLRPEALRGLRASTLQDHLAETYADDLRTDRIRITIYDELSGKRREIHVTGIQYTGIPVINNTFQLAKGKGVLGVELYARPNARGTGPTLRRKRVAANRLAAAFPELNRVPWSSTVGAIDYPDLGSDKELWTLDKKTPRDNATRREVLRILERQVEPEITRVLEQQEERGDNRHYEEIARDLGEALERALRDVVPDLRLGPGYGKHIRTRKPPSGSKRVIQRIRATVFDEHSQPVEDVRVELQNNGRREHRLTGLNGTVSFGIKPGGLYRITMVLPDGATPDQDCNYDYTFNLTKDRPGHNAVFTITLGREKPPGPSKNLPRFALTFSVLPDESIPYDDNQLEAAGTIVINMDHPTFTRAQDEKDNHLLEVHLANCVTWAIAEYAWKNLQDQYYLVKWFMLANSVLTNFREIRGKKKLVA